MAHTNSPPDRPSAPANTASKRATLHQFKALVLQIIRWTRGFLELQKIPYIANKVCELYLRDADEAQRSRCRRILQTRLELNPAQLRHFFHTSMGEQLLAWFGRFLQPLDDRDQIHHLQELIVQMASDPEGLSLLSFLRRFPDTQQINLDQLLFTAKRVEWLLQETEATIATIRELSLQEARGTPAIDFATLPDLRQAGSFTVQQSTIVVKRSPRHTASSGVPRSLQVVCYYPDPLPTGSIPVVIQSHGLASNPEDLEPYARHLASYGYLVAAPWHTGSDTEQVRRMLTGEATEVFQLGEFIDRPLDIRDLLDDLERRNLDQFQGKLNLTAVGVMGYSFGAYTAFALAGADIQFDKLELACGLTPGSDTNLSLLLQCQALGLPRQLYHLRDDRVQAILSLDAVGSEVFGQVGIQNIQVPVMLIAGSQDTIAPLALEQLRFFQWLTTPTHYLALMQGKSHVCDMQRLSRTLDLQVKVSPPTTKRGVPPFESYIKALSIAFFQGHLTQQTETLSYLNPHYTAYLSRSPFDLWLISQASSQGLQAPLFVSEGDAIANIEVAYGSFRPPSPPILGGTGAKVPQNWGI
ncbi:alpha/beta hydrolase [Pantanalinema rosaneae CENA516]|uniref:alpha/beta hydrolase n=1 Tax=Pantanalinema rosaneae TaxID=1620701 RepID=UPI003D6F82F1